MDYFTIDQSGKVEHINEDTILALASKKIQYSIKIPKNIKKKIFSKCRKRYKKNITLRLFAYCLYLLLKNKISINSKIIIDKEYYGHERDIKSLLLKNLKLKKYQINFSCVGKKDLSHKIAYKTFSGKLKPNEIITQKELNINKILPKNKIKKFLK